MNPTQELSTAKRIARDIDDFAELERSLGANDEARRKVVTLRHRRLAEVESVRLSTAGQLLGLSVPTIRAWVDRGLLDEIDGPSPRRVSLQRVLEVRPHVRELRALGRDRNLLEAVLARIEDEHMFSNPLLKHSLNEMTRGELADITP